MTALRRNQAGPGNEQKAGSMAAIVKDYLKALIGVAAAGAATAIAVTIVIAILRFDLVALLYG